MKPHYGEPAPYTRCWFRARTAFCRPLLQPHKVFPLSWKASSQMLQDNAEHGTTHEFQECRSITALHCCEVSSLIRNTAVYSTMMVNKNFINPWMVVLLEALGTEKVNPCPEFTKILRPLKERRDEGWREEKKDSGENSIGNTGEIQKLVYCNHINDPLLGRINPLLEITTPIIYFVSARRLPWNGIVSVQRRLLSCSLLSIFFLAQSPALHLLCFICRNVTLPVLVKSS